MKNNKSTLSEKATSIFSQYKRLRSTPSGNQHQKEYLKLISLCMVNQDELLELVFSGQIQDESDLFRLIWMGADGGSIEKKYNLSWIPFLKKVKNRVCELPLSIQSHFIWLGEVHHYWD